MRTINTLLIALITSLAFIAPASSEMLHLKYDGFQIWLDCDFRSSVMYAYKAKRDTGNFKRESSFYKDKEVPARCQQTSTKSYSKKLSNGRPYDRGHQAPANHFDFSKRAIHQTNFMTNILPQAAKMNRGAMYRTEKITECYRDIDDLLVMGGPIWRGDTSNDYFLKSHGIKTPEAYWKVIIRKDRVIAWIIPNIQDATAGMLDEYLVSVADIEAEIGFKIPTEDYLKQIKLESSWLIPQGCNIG